ncbi:hypothetical protein CHLRE_10g441450v5 [Chlamydomonas reinhardtii]|uniref:Kri1-like C-terminal domain-containing protein n=1 Tax=Chlamydomonas reinhardtii TaxID=3055 RepID=A0A2K3DAJ4_CHLRE|nr:uncharacterized protein CHLRE_10g441450v5 [Chlamydomonas reinhardtii]PNW77549.1 hypothetical protein CHLRE_10g441450v5 [Chlamydomonas reinhardtii]
MGPQKKKNLLDDEDGTDAPVDFSVRVNKEFAARFEHNERRKELHRLQAKYPEEAEKLARKLAREAAIAAGQQPAPDSDADSSDDEEEDEGEIPEETEAKIFETMLRIRQKDPAIYQKDVKFFDDEEEGGEEVEEGAGGAKQKKAKKEKPMYLKDMIAKHALEYGPEVSSDDEEEGGRKAGDSRHPKAYDPEQEAMRKAFLAAATEAEEGMDGEEALGGVLRPRGKSAGSEDDDEDEEEEEEEAPKPKKQKKEKKEKKVKKLADAYFADENDEDKFLKEYILNKGWVDREEGYVPSYREIVGDQDEDDGGEDGGDGIDDEEDERYLRSVDAFEAKYNFRYEEPGADRIITHPRNVEGTVRKEDDRRKRQRDAKKARQEAAEAEAREEVKRMKNLKKQEIESKLDKLRNVAGVAAPAATSLDDVLEGDFDPEEWDKKMAAAFNDDYYDAEEELEGLADDLDLLAGDSDEELGIAGAGLSSEGEEDDVEEEDGGEEDGEEGGKKKKPIKFADIRKKIKEVDALSEDPDDDEGDGKQAGGQKKKRADPAELARQRNELQRLLEDYYKLDYEDNVAGIKTRFRYKPVDPSTFGLSVDDILRLDDKSLNQVVGIKRLAPYREDATKLRPNYKALQMVTADAANAKQKRREYKKRDWEKGRDGRGGGKGGNWWQGKDVRDSGNGAGAGPGSAAANGSGEPERKQSDGEGKVTDAKHADQQQQQQQERKRKEREAGPGPGSRGDAAGGDGAGQKRQREDGGAGRGHGHGQGQGHGHGHGQGHGQGKGHFKPREWKPKQVDPQQARLASYAVPTLKKDNAGAAGPGGYKRKRDDADGGKHKQQQQQQPKSDGPQLSRAQKKNLKRTQKRAEKKATPGEPKAGEA